MILLVSAWKFTKNTRERTFECAGAEKQTAEKVGFRHLQFLLIQNS